MMDESQESKVSLAMASWVSLARVSWVSLAKVSLVSLARACEASSWTSSAVLRCSGRKSSACS